MQTLRRRAPGSPGQRGFTLIELLVVIVIVAILAAVAIPVFLRQRERGWESQIQSLLKEAAVSAEAYAVSNNGDYSGLDGDDGTLLAEEDFLIDTWLNLVDYVRVEATSNSFCIETRHTLLPAANPWKTAIYVSEVGAPQTAPGSCP